MMQTFLLAYRIIVEMGPLAVMRAIGAASRVRAARPSGSSGPHPIC
jgi:hypothetical protein